jgi:soluble lytic murein transglycosylase
VAAWALALGVVAASAPVAAQNGDAAIVEARDALRKKDGPRLAQLRAQALAENHPLAMWVDYWELNNRLSDATQAEFSAFSARWAGTYVDDRLRNDWLLELGKRRDWDNFAAEYPRFQLKDDREVACYAVAAQHLAGRDDRAGALAAWYAQREPDDGCALMAAMLTDAHLFTAADAWRKARLAIDAGRPRVARQAAALVLPAAALAVGELVDNPARYLTRAASVANRNAAELTTLALMRMAANDPDAALGQLQERWDRALPAELSAWAWMSVAKNAALKLDPQASDDFLRADQRDAASGVQTHWPDDMLAWKARAALRADFGHPRWQMVAQAIDAMGASEQRDPGWVFWKARALLALSADSEDGESMRTLARGQLAGISQQVNFYGALAAESLGLPVHLPTSPAPLTPAEREAAASHPGLGRALQLIGLGLRSEGVREWNYSVRDMGDRQLLAAAQWACDHEVWDRCINTSERTRDEIDMAQRYPMPFRDEVVARAREIGLDPAYVYGLIRQESRFVMDAHSGVGASGLMQLMPSTARWTAKKIGLSYTPDLLTDRDVNLRLGTAYLKLVLDDFGGSQALAAAAYNAGPGRPRKWRDGPTLETAIWTENVPLSETRDYVKKVLSNATYYSVQLGAATASLKVRLGRGVTAADPVLSEVDKDLP